MRCIECNGEQTEYWEFVEGIVCEPCLMADLDILHKYNLYMYDESGIELEEMVSANMVLYDELKEIKYATK